MQIEAESARGISRKGCLHLIDLAAGPATSTTAAAAPDSYGGYYEEEDVSHLAWLFVVCFERSVRMIRMAHINTRNAKQSLWSQNNQSLSELASVMATIKKQHRKQPQGKHASSAAPGAGFKDSALTALLRQSLGGDCKVRHRGSGSGFGGRMYLRTY